MNIIKDLIKLDKKPRRGLLAMEWIVVAYLVFTLLLVLFTYTKLYNPDAMIWGRVRILALTAALWVIYRLIPCKITLLIRVAVQLLTLGLWYPDTYEINRIFPNLDHIFAAWDQQLFGFQPALLFHQVCSSPIISELMDMGYWSYYPMIGATAFFYFLRRYQNFERCVFVIIASFFTYYLIYDFLPVVGPTFYYKAVGVGEIAKGVFPNMHDYFATHQDCLASPGYTEGMFYQLVESAKEAGERPTAAFPSSHVGVSTICMLLVMKTKNKKFLYILLPFYVFMCMATVYIQAHYAVDVLAGWTTGVIFFYTYWTLFKWIKK